METWSQLVVVVAAADTGADVVVGKRRCLPLPQIIEASAVVEHRKHQTQV